MVKIKAYIDRGSNAEGNHDVTSPDDVTLGIAKQAEGDSFVDITLSVHEPEIGFYRDVTVLLDHVGAMRLMIELGYHLRTM